MERHDLFKIIWHPLTEADEIASLARRLGMDTIPHDYISTLLACRLVLLKKKDNGIRPVGVGECLRRITSKTITGLLKEDMIHAVGTLQTCAAEMIGSGFSLSRPILFLKNDIRSESCFGWNHTIRFRKLSESVLRCTTYIFVLGLFCLIRQNDCWSHFAFS